MSYIVFGLACIAVFYWRKPIWAKVQDWAYAMWEDDNESNGGV